MAKVEESLLPLFEQLLVLFIILFFIIINIEIIKKYRKKRNKNE